MKAVVFIVLCLGVANGMDVNFKDCGSVLGKVASVTVEPCDVQPCQLKQGSNYSIGINFQTLEADNTVKAYIHGILDGIPVPFPFDQTDACKASGLDCPLKPEMAYKYTATLPILSSYPKVKVIVKWELQDGDKEKDITCIELPAVVVGSSAREQKAPRKLHVNW